MPNNHVDCQVILLENLHRLYVQTPKFASNFDPAVYTSAIGLEILLTEIPIFDLLDNNTSLKDFDNVIKDTLNELVVIQ